MLPFSPYFLSRIFPVSHPRNLPPLYSLLKAAQTLFSIIRDTDHKLAVLDISGNEFAAEHFELMRLSMGSNRVLSGLDMRANPGYSEATRAVAEIDKMVHTNEFHSRRGEGHP
jgi:hypothetical protein